MSEAEIVVPVRPRDGLAWTRYRAGDSIVLDTANQSAHALDASSSLVWGAMDGARSLNEIAAVTGVSRDDVEVVLAKLSEFGLLDERNLDGQTRRTALKRVAQVGVGAALVAPFVESLALPALAAAASETGNVTYITGPNTQAAPMFYYGNGMTAVAMTPGTAYYFSSTGTESSTPPSGGGIEVVVTAPASPSTASPTISVTNLFPAGNTISVSSTSGTPAGPTKVNGGANLVVSVPYNSAGFATLTY